VSTISRENPARIDEVVGTVAVASADDVDAAVRGAHGGFLRWSRRPVEERVHALLVAADELDPRLDEWAVLMARETGKPRADCRGELGFAVALLRWTCGRAADACATSEIDDAGGRLVTRKVPYGVVAAITPWNAPVILAMLKLAPALATGNACVVKPSPLAPFTLAAVCEVLARHAPVAVVQGGAETGVALVGHPLVRKVAFTGGEATARAIGAVAAEAITPTVMELGGNDAAILLPDAGLSDEALDRLVMASFATSGQVCMAAKRVYVHSSRYDELVAGYVAAASRVLVTGDPLTDGVTMGPVATAATRDRLAVLASDVPSTVRLGSTVGDLSRGYFVEPLLALGCADEHPVVVTEQFGPLLPILRYDSEDEVIARANASELGLGASVWSADEDHAFAVAARLESGVAFVNTHARTGMGLRVPFGGVKKSGWGREYGDLGLEEYLQVQAIHAPAAFRAGGTGSGAASYPTG
jgi:acyl-CoA reductase-like NAD-dependent aldehyde dehydrogenase